MDQNLSVAITGASSGIGRALAKQFHSLGYSVLLIARREERLKELVAELNNKRPDSAEYRTCDLTDRTQTTELAQFLASKSIHGLINNAGRGSLGRFIDHDLDSELSQIELNVNSPLILTHAVVPGMMSIGKGFVINVSSIMAYQAVPFVATYAATKSFEWLHSVAISRELEDKGIKVMTLCPGPTETEFFGVANVPNHFGTFKRKSAESVAKACIKSLMKGERVCIPNWQARYLIYAAKLCPASLYTWVIKKILAPKYGLK